MNMQQDEAFLHLLSSQRELLSQLHMENSFRGGGREVGGSSSCGGGGVGMQFYHHPGVNHRMADSYLNRPPTGILSNHSNAGNTFAGCNGGGRSNNEDALLAKSLTIGFGTDPFLLSLAFPTDDRADGTFGFGDGQGGGGDLKLVHKDVPAFKAKRAPEGVEEAQFYKKRRLSSIGFFSSSFFEDGLEQSRRGSMTFMSKLATVTAVTSNEIDCCGDDDTASILSENKDEAIGDHIIDDDDDVSIASVPVEPIELDMADVNPAKFKTVFQAFTTSMEKSAKSQQEIHDWDRKMGLKRSHSKTMRQSSRSRKKLRAILKKRNVKIGLSDDADIIKYKYLEGLGLHNKKEFR